MNQPHPDWIWHGLTIDGPESDLAALRDRAAGAGVVPWRIDYDRCAEDWFHWLISASPRERLSLAEARYLAGQLREAVWMTHETATGWVGRARGCPFDLHRLAPVPDALLQLGPDDPESRDWLWSNWGTTWCLRHVRPLPAAAFGVEFFAADWTPWPVIARLRSDYPTLRFALEVRY